ncbi:uncharacterized protein LOC117316927 [Pecten maximus]|uniref:uncharacterized protein LOC117316927 n=1 Tax=Pecten maximus TaxID=6579 RepID=UPI001458069F|nr:uncharacterized protein LOC117316927 [Pecten maximus]
MLKTMNSLRVACVLAICVTCSHAIGEKIYLKAADHAYFALSTITGKFVGQTRTPEPGYSVISMDHFKALLKHFSGTSNIQSAHRLVSPNLNTPQMAEPQVRGGNLDYGSAFSNDGTSSTYFKNRDEMQNHPITQPTQDDLNQQGFANPRDPFTGRVYA